MSQRKEDDSLSKRMSLIELDDFVPPRQPALKKNPFAGMKAPTLSRDPVIGPKTIPGRHCSWCGKPMVLRHRKKDGAAFYGCSAFPDCRRAVDAGTIDDDDRLEEEQDDRDEELLPELDF